MDNGSRVAGDELIKGRWRNRVESGEINQGGADQVLELVAASGEKP